MISRQIIRKFTTSAIRKSSEEGDGIPGYNVPFPMKNRYLLTLIFTVFSGSGVALPFLVTRHQMLK